MNINDYVKDECDRQHRDNYDDFRKAFDDAAKLTHADISGSIHSLPAFVCRIAHDVEPDVNTYHVGTNFANLRSSHVGFYNGGSACPTNEVPERFERWARLTLDMLPTIRANPGDTNVYYTDGLIKQLLDVHPWSDGNGRTASILRNWMLGTMHDPEPLPYYYGDK